MPGRPERDIPRRAQAGDACWCPRLCKPFGPLPWTRSRVDTSGSDAWGKPTDSCSRRKRRGWIDRSSTPLSWDL